MRALTVKQPWAWALIHGEKRVENRTWSTKYRGVLAVHAGASVDAGWVDCEPMADALLTHGNDVVLGYRGAVIGVTHLIAIHKEKDGCCAPWGERGMYHWVTNDPQPLSRPIKARGNTSLWDLDDDLIRDVPRGYLSGPPGARVPQYESGPVPMYPEGCEDEEVQQDCHPECRQGDHHAECEWYEWRYPQAADAVRPPLSREE